MKSFYLIGEVIKLDFESGNWGILGGNGKQYLPINFPEQLKEAGAVVKLRVLVRDDMAGIQMWGQLVEITSFETF